MLPSPAGIPVSHTEAAQPLATRRQELAVIEWCLLFARMLVVGNSDDVPCWPPLDILPRAVKVDVLFMVTFGITYVLMPQCGSIGLGASLQSSSLINCWKIV
mmetsp:Transcript_167585/g.538182  ORF Transcript_167585/g.538182 Transcript_167585/m.538182 type:complete len:102 (-) Transcript_167585:317-622(-)